MTDSPPQLGQIPQQSGFKIPTLSSDMEGSNGSQQVANAKESIYNSKVGFSPLPITNNAGTNIDTCSTLPARVTAPRELTSSYRCLSRRKYCAKSSSDSECQGNADQWLVQVIF